jgi:hypothetical protein
VLTLWRRDSVGVQGSVTVPIELAQQRAEKVTGVSRNSMRPIKREGRKYEFGRGTSFQILDNKIKWKTTLVYLNEFFEPIFRR